MTKGHWYLGLDPGTKKKKKKQGALDKNKGNPNRVWTSVNNSISIPVHQLWQMCYTDVKC